MKVFTSRDFKGHWPVGTAAVIVAENEQEAAELLTEVAAMRGLEIGDDFTLQEVPITQTQAIILRDGDY